jgi:hypothetical protein
MDKLIQDRFNAAWLPWNPYAIIRLVQAKTIWKGSVIIFITCSWSWWLWNVLQTTLYRGKTLSIGLHSNQVIKWILLFAYTITTQKYIATKPIC